MKKEIFTINDESYYLIVSNYSNNKRLYLGLEDRGGELYTDITINLSDLDLYDNSIFLSNDLSDEFIKKLQESGIIIDILNVNQYNMGRYKFATIDINKIKEFDPEGYKNIKSDNYEL